MSFVILHIMSYCPQEAQDEDSDVTIIPGDDPYAGMPASEAEIHSIDCTRGPLMKIWGCQVIVYSDIYGFAML